MSESPNPPPSSSQAVLAELTALATPPNTERYMPFIQNAISTSNVSNIKALITFLCYNTLPVPAARILHNQVIQLVLQNLSDQAILDIAEALFAAHTQSTRAFALETSTIPLRHRLATIYEARADPLSAADVLVKMPMETLATGQDHALLRCNLNIARLYTAASHPAKAVPYLNRASKELNPDTDPSLWREYRVIHAETSHAHGKFLDAAAKYHQLSQHSANGDWLQRSVICAILAPAGPRRSRILATLFSDERVRSLEVFPLLECIHMGRLLSQDQVENFRSRLAAGQEEGVLDHAVMEHNLLAASRLYADIGFEELGTLLGVTAAKAETTAADMINESRLTATIDQVEGVLKFAQLGKTAQIERWDAHIASLCTAIDDTVEAIVAKFPQFASYLEA